MTDGGFPGRPQKKSGKYPGLEKYPCFLGVSSPATLKLRERVRTLQRPLLKNRNNLKVGMIYCRTESFEKLTAGANVKGFEQKKINGAETGAIAG